MAALAVAKPEEKRRQAKAPAAAATTSAPQASTGAPAGMPRFLQSAAPEAKAPARPKVPAPAAHPDAAAAAAAAGVAPAGPTVVVLKMPEPPSTLSPANRARLHRSSAAAASAARAHAALPHAHDMVQDAQHAVTVPAQEADAHAQDALVKELAGQVKPDPKIEKLCERIREVILSKRPPDEDHLVDAKPEDMAKQSSADVHADVDKGIQGVQQNYAGIQQTPQGPKSAPGQTIVPPTSTVATPPIQAAQGAPDAVPAASVSLDADVQANRQSIDDAGMNTPEAQLIQTGPVAEAREQQGNLEQVAAEAPAQVLLKQQQELAGARADMAALQQRALAALTASRQHAISGTGAHQHDMVGNEEQQRAEAGKAAHDIFTSTQDTVNGLLRELPKTAMAKWEKASKAAVQNFKNTLGDVEKRIDDRHSGVGGFFLGIGDWATGLPGWVTDDYDRAEKQFGDEICAVAREISIDVNTVVASCQRLIADAKTRIANIFSGFSGSLASWAAEEQKKFGTQLDALNKRAVDTRDDFTKDLVQRAGGAVQEVREQVQELRIKASGIAGRIANAVGAFLKDPLKFIINGLLDLVGISPASFWALIAKIAQVIGDIARHPLRFAENLLSAVGQGFSLFFDHFTDHLIHGFLDWLTGGLADAGVTLPKDFSLPSIVTFFLQLMGFTWERIRRLIAKHVGEKNVALLEKVYGTVSQLIALGPAGIYEMIRERLNPAELLDQVVRAAVKYVVEALIEKVMVRVLLLFNPVGAIAQAIEAIYRVLRWIFVNAARIFTLVETVVNGMADIVAGNLGGMAKAVENALAGLIAPIIDFLADYLGLGGLPGKVRDTIIGFQHWVEGLLDKAIGWLVEKGKKLLEMVGLSPGPGVAAAKPGAVGPGDEHVGRDLAWTADGEQHHLWIVTDGSRCVVMMASETVSVETQLGVYRKLADKLGAAARKKIVGKIDAADKELVRLDKEAAKMAKDVKRPDPKPDQTEGEEKEVEREESTLARLLREIQEDLGLSGKWGTEEQPIPLDWPKRRLAAYPVLYFGPRIPVSSDGIKQDVLRDAYLSPPQRQGQAGNPRRVGRHRLRQGVEGARRSHRKIRAHRFGRAARWRRDDRRAGGTTARRRHEDPGR